MFFVVALGVGIALSVRPWREYHESSKKTEAALQAAEAANAEHANLLREKALLESSEGKEMKAREQGFLKPGEVSLRR